MDPMRAKLLRLAGPNQIPIAAQLDLAHLKYDNKDDRKSIETAFNRLVLPDGHKEMVEALVTQHFQGRTVAPIHGVQPDLIRGKGRF